MGTFNNIKNGVEYLSIKNNTYFNSVKKGSDNSSTYNEMTTLTNNMTTPQLSIDDSITTS